MAKGKKTSETQDSKPLGEELSPVDKDESKESAAEATAGPDGEAPEQSEHTAEVEDQESTESDPDSDLVEPLESEEAQEHQTEPEMVGETESPEDTEFAEEEINEGGSGDSSANQKIGASQRFSLREKLFKSKKVKQQVFDEPTNNDLNSGVKHEPEAVLTKAQIAKKVSRLQKSISSIEKQLLEIEKTTQQNQDALTKAEEKMMQLDDWNIRQNRSFFWKLKERMSSNLNQSKSDLEYLENQVSELDLPEPGTLIDMRGSFHKTLIRSFLIVTIPIFLLFFIPWAARNDLGGAIIGAVLQGWAIPVFAVLVAIFSGFWFLIRRGFKANEKKVPWKKFWTQVLIILLVIGLLALFLFAENFMRFQLTPILESIRPLTTTLLLIGLFFAFLGASISYYSKWSEFRRTVVEQYAKLDNVVNGYIGTKQEIVRLEGLYEQLVEWIEILAHAAYRPWKINERWTSKEELKSASENMPRALRVAQAIESDPADTARLDSKIGELLLTQGWRSQAFLESLESISELKGLTTEHLSIDKLEKDLPHQPNKTRELILKTYRSLDDSDGSFLEKVARHRVEELASRSQAFALSEAQPQVEQLIEDPLRVLLGSQLEESSTVITAEWDDYLSRGLSLSNENQPPLSPLTFTESGIMNKSSAPNVFVLAPSKVAEKLRAVASESVELLALEQSEITPRAEIVLRVDVASPTAFENVHLVSRAMPNIRPAQMSSVDDSQENQDL